LETVLPAASNFPTGAVEDDIMIEVDFAERAVLGGIYIRQAN
jgi:hypothetical protein